MSGRFYVAETNGHRLPGVGPVPPGLSVMVLDRLHCHRPVRQWRSETYRRGGRLARDERLAKMREEAAVHAARLTDDWETTLREEAA